MGFATPTQRESSREYFRLKNYVDELLVFEVDEYDPAYLNPKFKKDGARPTVWAQVTVLTGEDAGKVWPREEINAQYVVEALADHAGGEPVLSRIERGQEGGKPFFANPPGDDDFEIAEAFYEVGPQEASEEADPRDEDDDVPPWER